MKNTNTKTPNDRKEIKYPFSGVAPNLIDKFLVLGYDQKTIDFTYQNCNVDAKEFINSRFIFFEFEERPEVVNEICNDYSKDLLDNDLISELIFPNYPQMYFLEREYINTPKELDEELATNPYSIIFSINPQDNYGSKKSYNGLGYVFYILQEHKVGDEIDGYLYIPAAYVILSEFPYFYQFNSICSDIYNRIKKESDEIPIDIIIYNTIKFTPSPINKNINLIFGNQFGFPQNNIDIEKIISNLNSKGRRDRAGIPSMFFPQLTGYPFVDINMSFIFNLIPPEIIIEVFIFSFLEHDIIFYSSKPDLLNMIMYIFTCFNYPFNDSIYYWHILSVSQESFMTGTSTFVGKTSSTMTGILSVYDPEVLTTKKIKEHFVLDIDNKNFFYLYQEDNDEVKQTMELYTYIKNCTEYIINSKSYAETKLSESEEKYHYPDGIHLFECIRKLLEELIRRSKKVTAVDYNKLNIIKPNFFNIYEDESEMSCIESNKRLQEAFLLFIIQIMKNYVKTKSSEENEKKIENINYSKNIGSSIAESKKEEKNSKIEKKDQKDKKESEQNEKLALEKKRILAKKAGQIFTEKFKDSSKFNSFVINFCKFNETIDLYKVPYNFINEFIYYSQFSFSQNLNEVLTFKLIDQFYGKRKLLDFEEIINKKQNEIDIKKNIKNPNPKKEKEKKKEKKSTAEKEKERIMQAEKEIKFIDLKKENDEFQNIYLFSFDNFSDYYQNNLRALINREQEDDKENFTKVKSINRQYKKYKKNNYFLSQKILNIYITFTNNNLDELLKTFKLIECKHKKSDNDKLNNPDENSSININKGISNNLNLEKDSNNKISSEESELNKTEVIDYFYIFKNKNSYNKSLKEKYFGTFDNIEIANIIEDNFILERYFSSYTILKYSLLNVLAVTREIESKIINNQDAIRIICNFCDITKLVVKKYMNIYLKIFKEKYQNKESREKYQIKECLNIISLFFKKKNLVLSEENEKFLNEIKEQINSLEIVPNNCNFIEYVKKVGNFFEMTEGFFHSNKRSKFESSLQTIETVYIGKYENKVKDEKIFDFNYKELNNLYNQNKNNKNKKFLPKTPILLYDNTNKILKKYLKNFSKENIPYNDLYDDILSLLFYFKIPIIEDKWVENSEKYKKAENSEGKKLKSDKKKKKDEEKAKSQKSKINDKEKKKKPGNKKEKNKLKTDINKTNNGENLCNLELDEENISTINGDISKSDQNEVSNSKIYEESFDKKENLIIIDYKESIRMDELKEILKKIIAILYDLLNNIKEKI